MSKKRLPSALKIKEKYGPELSSLLLGTMTPLEREVLGMNNVPKKRQISFWSDPKDRLEGKAAMREQNPPHIVDNLTHAAVMKLGKQLSLREEERKSMIVDLFGSDIKENLCVKCIEQMEELIRVEREKRIIETELLIKDLEQIAASQKHQTNCMMKHFYLKLAESDLTKWTSKIQKDGDQIREDAELNIVEQATKTAREKNLPKNFAFLLKEHAEITYLDSLNSIWKMFGTFNEKANNLYRRRKILDAMSEIQIHNCFVYNEELPLLQDFRNAFLQLKVDLELMAVPIPTCKMRIRTTKRRSTKKLQPQSSIEFFELKEKPSDETDNPLLLRDCALLPYYIPPTRSLSSINVSGKTYHSIRRIINGPAKKKVWKWQKDTISATDPGEQCERDN